MVEKRIRIRAGVHLHQNIGGVAYWRPFQCLLTPVKGVKGQPEVIKQRDKAADDLFSTAVSTIRQPIESLFNWLIVNTDIQRASKVRSTNGLLVHIFGKIAAAFIYLVF